MQTCRVSQKTYSVIARRGITASLHVRIEVRALGEKNCSEVRRKLHRKSHVLTDLNPLPPTIKEQILLSFRYILLMKVLGESY